MKKELTDEIFFMAFNDNTQRSFFVSLAIILHEKYNVIHNYNRLIHTSRTKQYLSDQ